MNTSNNVVPLVKDTSGQPYREVDIPDGEHVRITLIEEHKNWKQPTLRIQIRDENGHLRQGPEIPESAFADFVGAAIDLLVNRSNR